MKRIVVLTGAGISAESGLATFRDADGLWARYRIEDVATPEAFARDPAGVLEFYNARRAQARATRPNPAHHALAELERLPGHDVLIVTQNVDGLHEAAGSRRVLHMHGRLDGALCVSCGHRWEAPETMRTSDRCPACGARATCPDVVWFGEVPYHMDEIQSALMQADVFAAIGTSGQVYPAAGFVEVARIAGARTLGFDMDPAAVSGRFDETFIGPASRTVPAWVRGLKNS